METNSKNKKVKKIIISLAIIVSILVFVFLLISVLLFGDVFDSSTGTISLETTTSVYEQLLQDPIPEGEDDCVDVDTTPIPIGISEEALMQFEDEVFSPKVIINSNRIKYSNLPFYIYRRRDGSITTNIAKSNKWLESYLKIIDNLSDFSKKIINTKSYTFLKSRIENLTLSILKNPIKYKSSKENLEEIINIVKKDKLYKIPQKSNNILIKIQGYIMKYPKIFIILYKMREDK